MKANVFDTQQLEECDNFPADSTSIMRVDRNLQCITHTVSCNSIAANSVQKQVQMKNNFFIVMGFVWGF